MGKTSNAVKSRYNAKAYDQLAVRIPKGMRDDFKSACDMNGDSMSAVIQEAIRAYLAKTSEKGN